MSSESKESTNWNALLFIIYWGAVVIECVALLNKKYTYYGFSRAILVPILLVRIITSGLGHKVNRYVSLFFFISMLADLFTIFGTPNIGYIGLNLYTVSYLSLVSFFLQLKDSYHSSSLLVFLITLITIASISALWLDAPELHQQIFYIHVAIHSLTMVLIVYSFLSVQSKLMPRSTDNFFVSLLFIIVTNLLYALDVFYFKFKHASIESLIGLGNGIYLFQITRGALNQIKKMK